MIFPDTITLPYTQDYETPFGEEALDQFPSSLPRYFIENYSDKGAKIFDPFIGFGTTAFVAEDLARIPYGIEADEERHGWAAGQLEHWQNVICGDADDIADFNFPKMDLCVTSPPWMEQGDDWNPLFGDDRDYAGYDFYLSRLGEVFKGIKSVMQDDAFIIVHVQDVNDTPLIVDFRRVISAHTHFISRVSIAFENAPADFEKTDCLVFKVD